MDVNRNIEMDSYCMWDNKKHTQETTALERFMQFAEKSYGEKFDCNYWKLHSWSCENISKFWEAVWKFYDVKCSEMFTKAFDDVQKISDIPVKWFSNAKLNYAENILLSGEPYDIAIYFAGEKTDGKVCSMTFQELRHSVGLYAQALKTLGVTVGDRVAGYMPNCPETVIAMLATAAIGAVWSSTSPDFGVTGVLERLRQVEPKVLFTVEAVKYNNKHHDNVKKVIDVVNDLPCLEKVVLIPFISDDVSSDCSKIPKCISISEFLEKAYKAGGDGEEFKFEQVSPDHPLFIMFSSGTTGHPKCLCHSVGGTLLKHLVEHGLQSNLKKGDVLFFYTTAGWMMWNWMVSALALGASIVLFDGSPFFPRPNILFDLIDEIKINFLGMGAKCFAVFEDKGLKPKETHNLSSLRCILSTGSPLKPQSFDYIYTCIKSDVIVGSISGGTDIIGCFVGVCWLVPVHRGESQVPYLGCRVACVDRNGCPLEGERGELICSTPFPSMPTCFLKDPDNAKYKKAYFSAFPDVWAHGDYCIINPKTGGIVMLGRSDGTLNPGGVRFGSAEIYNIVENITSIEDALCVGQAIPGGDERVILFLKMAETEELTEKLEAQVRQMIRQQLSPRHVPSLIFAAPDIPYTHNGKKVEIAVKRILCGDPVVNKSSLRNPECLEFYSKLSAGSLNFATL